MDLQVKKVIRSLLPLSLILPFYNFVIRIAWLFNGVLVLSSFGLIRLIKSGKEIRLSSAHKLYLKDTLENFDFYFGGVEAPQSNKMIIVDYSKPAWHDVHGFDLMPVHFNSVSEPIITTKQYIDFANLKNGSIAIDLGAYSALTSILLDQCVGSDGLVIAVEADENNLKSCIKNLSLYKKITNRNIELINAAIWEHENGIYFSAEGNMGSSAADVVGDDRSECIKVKTVTLSGIAKKYNLSNIDFIKCDIEGAEEIALNNQKFFDKYHPKLVIECHYINGVSTGERCKTLMERFGYKCEYREQQGYPLPLLFCIPHDIHRSI